MNYPVRVFWLTKRAPDALGLVCDGEGVMLGPLIRASREQQPRHSFSKIVS